MTFTKHKTLKIMVAALIAQTFGTTLDIRNAVAKEVAPTANTTMHSWIDANLDTISSSLTEGKASDSQLIEVANHMLSTAQLDSMLFTLDKGALPDVRQSYFNVASHTLLQAGNALVPAGGVPAGQTIVELGKKAWDLLNRIALVSVDAKIKSLIASGFVLSGPDGKVKAEDIYNITSLIPDNGSFKVSTPVTGTFVSTVLEYKSSDAALGALPLATSDSTVQQLWDKTSSVKTSPTGLPVTDSDSWERTYESIVDGLPILLGKKDDVTVSKQIMANAIAQILIPAITPAAALTPATASAVTDSDKITAIYSALTGVSAVAGNNVFDNQTIVNALRSVGVSYENILLSPIVSGNKDLLSLVLSQVNGEKDTVKERVENTLAGLIQFFNTSIGFDKVESQSLMSNTIKTFTHKTPAKLATVIQTLLSNTAASVYLFPTQASDTDKLAAITEAMISEGVSTEDIALSLFFSGINSDYNLIEADVAGVNIGTANAIILKAGQNAVNTMKAVTTDGKTKAFTTDEIMQAFPANTTNQGFSFNVLTTSYTLNKTLKFVPSISSPKF